MLLPDYVSGSREKSLDDFWKARLMCLENGYYDSLRATETEFARLEKMIKNLSHKDSKFCVLGKDVLFRCLSMFGEHPTKCSETVRKMENCIDVKGMNISKNAYLEFLRRQKKQAKVCR